MRYVIDTDMQTVKLLREERTRRWRERVRRRRTRLRLVGVYRVEGGSHLNLQRQLSRPDTFDLAMRGVSPEALLTRVRSARG